MSFNRIPAVEAASLIKHGYNIGLSGFTPAGIAKAVTAELAKIAEAEHVRGNPFQVGIFIGTSTEGSCNGVMSRAKAIRYRALYTTSSDFRRAVNNGGVIYNDIHLSQMMREVRYDFMGRVSVAIIEAYEVTPNGKIYLTTADSISPAICRLADQIIVELNATHSKSCIGLHDMYEPLDPLYHREIPIYKSGDRIGLPYIQIDPKKIVGVVGTDWPDETYSFADADPLTDKIGQDVADFPAADMKHGIIPSTFPLLQSGVGNITNAMLDALGCDKTIPTFEVYTEVIQNSAIGLIREGHIKFGSACSLTVANDCLKGVYNDMDFFRNKLVLRPSGVSDNPEVVRRLGIISINTAIEIDSYGDVDSAHIGGTKMMNSIGDSGSFTRNAYISIFTCLSVAKEGKISAIVPMVFHLNHSEHSVNIIVTEQGVADLRGRSPRERAQAIVGNCTHPGYKQLLWDYLKLAGGRVQTPRAIQAAFGIHAELAKSRDMENTSWAGYARWGMKRLSSILPFIVCIYAASANDVFSQKKELQQFKGKVTNLQGEPVRTVGIYIPGTGRCASSDMNGDFSVEARHKEIPRFSHIGMKNALIQLDKDFPSELLVRIKPDAFQINNIFIQKKQIIKVKPKDMPERTMISFIINGPDFPGGLGGFDESIKRNIRYPEGAFQAGEGGQVAVEFTIDINGYIGGAEVTKNVSASLDKEALCIIKSMPR